MALNNTLRVNSQSGMTLLEVLVAMTLMVIISAISYASLNGLIDAKIHTDKVAKDIRQEMLTSLQLNKDIHALIKRKAKNEFGEEKPAIIGRYSFIEFTRNGHNNPLNQHRSDLQRIQWFIRDGQLYRRSLNFVDSGSFPQWQERKYMDNIAELNISYINSAGLESRVWPIENNRSTLKFIQFNLVLENKSALKYQLRPVL
ncbi:MAG: prepilin-type N-terminal cleavage/methylation domain-containing protein [Alcanivoracaceae bacterium]|nr:prepilin-type N-terminal cleavage/methylation domain-containing protein [Alcanivoracaceae bacterium]